MGPAAAGRCPARAGAHDWDRRDDARSQRGHAEHRAPGLERGVRGVADPARRGVRDRYADAGRAGPVRPDADEERVQRRLDAPPGSGREDHEDEGRPHSPGAYRRARRRPGDRGHCGRDGPGRPYGRHHHHGRDAYHGGGTGRSGGRGRDHRGRRRQGVSQQRDDGGVRGPRRAQLRLGIRILQRGTSSAVSANGPTTSSATPNR